MRKFTHLQASTVNEAFQNAAGKGMVIAGGTDLLGTLKDEILPVYPAVVVDLKTIPGLDKIEEEDGSLLIGAMTRLADVASHEAVKKHCQALSEACGKVASPTIRNMATLGGNICQMHRCWYFRTPDDRFHCSRKGGSTCPAYMGDNRYHSIFGVRTAVWRPAATTRPRRLSPLELPSSRQSGKFWPKGFSRPTGLSPAFWRMGRL